MNKKCAVALAQLWNRHTQYTEIGALDCYKSGEGHALITKSAAKLIVEKQKKILCMIQYILAFSEAEIVDVYQNMKNNKDLRLRKRSLKVFVNSENHSKS